MEMVNVMLDIYNIIITVILMCYLLTGKKFYLKLNRFFVYMCACNIIMILGDIPNWLCEGFGQPWYPDILKFGTFIFYVFSAPLLLAFVCYIIEYLSEDVKVHRGFMYISFVLSIIHVILIILSQFNNMFYHFNEFNQYVRGEWFLFSQVIPFFIYLIGCIIIIVFRKYMQKRDFICLSAYIALPALAELFQINNYGIALLNTAITVNLLLIFVNIQYEREQLIQKREKELAESKIDIMLSQIKPHFLYNTLTTIRQLCEIDSDAAKEAIRDFSFFLRANMNSLTNKSPIFFTQELNHVEHYLKLEKQRFQERLEIIYDIQVEDFCIPALSIQPLVENAVRHGIMKTDKGGVIIIRSEEKESSFVITVLDNGVGFEQTLMTNDNEVHIGIENVKERLKSMCNGTLTIESMIDVGTTVIITIPKERK